MTIYNGLKVVGDTATEVWDEWYGILSKQDLKEPSRVGEVTGEVLNAVTIINDPTRGIIQSKIRKMPMRYAVGELLWYLSGSNKLRDIEGYSPFWKNITDDGETLNSAYGYRIFHQFGFDQWEYVKDKLIADPSSRQAIIHIKDASNESTKDTPCTLSLQYQIRDGKLYATTFMRSNDLWKGFTYDIFAFTAFQVLLAMELGVGIGSYTHIAGSFHLYTEDVVKNV